jgi:DNA-directed RNA polymerase subunit RPC12/RpoP
MKMNIYFQDLKLQVIGHSPEKHIIIKENHIFLSLQQLVFDDDEEHSDYLFLKIILRFKMIESKCPFYDSIIYEDIQRRVHNIVNTPYLNLEKSKSILNKYSKKLYKIIEYIYDNINGCNVCHKNFSENICSYCLINNNKIITNFLNKKSIDICFCGHDDKLDTLMKSCYGCNYIMHYDCFKNLLATKNDDYIDCPKCRHKIYKKIEHLLNSKNLLKNY